MAVSSNCVRTVSSSETKMFPVSPWQKFAHSWLRLFTIFFGSLFLQTILWSGRCCLTLVYSGAWSERSIQGSWACGTGMFWKWRSVGWGEGQWNKIVSESGQRKVAGSRKASPRRWHPGSDVGTEIWMLRRGSHAKTVVKDILGQEGSECNVSQAD